MFISVLPPVPPYEMVTDRPDGGRRIKKTLTSSPDPDGLCSASF